MNAYCCQDCWQEENANIGIGVSGWTPMRMIVCAVCGNKRCPKATNHRLTCTGSNEPGQPGSIYR